MAEFGFWELMLIMLVALLIVGPDRLPKLATQIGHWMGRIRRLAQTFKDELSQEAARDTLYKTIGTDKEAVKTLTEDLQKTGADINQGLRDLDPLAKSMESQIEAGRFSPPDTSDSALDENYDNHEKKE